MRGLADPLCHSRFLRIDHVDLCRSLLNSRLALRVAAWDVPRTGAGTAWRSSEPSGRTERPAHYPWPHPYLRTFVGRVLRLKRSPGGSEVT